MKTYRFPRNCSDRLGRKVYFRSAIQRQPSGRYRYYQSPEQLQITAFIEELRLGADSTTAGERRHIIERLHVEGTVWPDGEHRVRVQRVRERWVAIEWTGELLVVHPASPRPVSWMVAGRQL